MANITFEAISRLIANSSIFKIIGNIKNVILGVSDYLDICRLFSKNISKESLPKYSELLIDDWVSTVGVTVPTGATTAEKQRVVSTVLRGTGGQSLSYLNDIINDIFPEIYIEESEASPQYPQYFFVKGVYDYSKDYNLLRSTVMRICPLHLDVFYFVRSRYDATIGICGIGACGEAITGLKETAQRI